MTITTIPKKSLVILVLLTSSGIAWGSQEKPSAPPPQTGPESHPSTKGSPGAEPTRSAAATGA